MRKAPSMSSSASSATAASRLDAANNLPEVDPAILVPVKTIGKGCFGKVVLARHDDELVAVKLIAKHNLQTRGDMNKVYTELKVMKSIAMSSPFLCGTRGTFQTDDVLMLTMNFAGGGDLFFHLQAEGAFSESRTRLIAMQIIIGLQHLHLRGVVHRDLKPENVLITNEGRIQLTDFGLSKFLKRASCAEDGGGESRLSYTSDFGASSLGMGSSPSSPFGCFPGLFKRTDKRSTPIWGTTLTKCGTPTYRCPQVVEGKPYGLEADYWAVGCIIYECLTGVPVFTGNSLKELHNAIVHDKPNFKGRFRIISSRARSIIMELLQKDRTKRLGYGGAGARNVRAHPFFMQPDSRQSKNWYSWEQVSNLEAPPVVYLSPDGVVTDPSELRFVPAEFTNLDVVECVPPSPRRNLDGFRRIPNELLHGKFIATDMPIPDVLNPTTANAY